MVFMREVMEVMCVPVKCVCVWWQVWQEQYLIEKCWMGLMQSLDCQNLKWQKLAISNGVLDIRNYYQISVRSS